MKAIFDTSSLLAFVRYYLPFDKNGTFKLLLQNKFIKREFEILDSVISESKFISQGIILKELAFLNEKSMHINSKDLIPNAKFFNLLENQFQNKEIRKLKDINDAEFELEKKRFLSTADARLILYALSITNLDPIIVTEETKNPNDNKIFKKIPENCTAIQIKCCTLPVLFKDYLNLDLSNLL